ncbi:MAG: type secretion system protein ImpK [Thermoanaerobaculia bacterium]|jgi:type VI secretion system protein ImpK|nr:type secretion system protein ImpK [Thermoanaerobaculia bacterium]
MTVALIDRFHEFYVELLEVHAQLDKGSIAVDEAHDRLAKLLDRQEADSQRELGAYGRETFQRAKYAMAALGDEILLNPAHAHGAAWKHHMLESKLFRSQRAGEKIFDEIAEMQNLGPAAAELARVYLAILSLGFQGIFRLRDPEAELEPYRRKLFRLAYGRGPVSATGKERIVDAAYKSTLIDGEQKQLPHLRPWIYAMVLLAVLYVAGSFALWHEATKDLQPYVQTINDANFHKGAEGKP